MVEFLCVTPEEGLLLLVVAVLDVVTTVFVDVGQLLDATVLGGLTGLVKYLRLRSSRFPETDTINATKLIKIRSKLSRNGQLTIMLDSGASRSGVIGRGWNAGYDRIRFRR